MARAASLILSALLVATAVAAPRPAHATDPTRAAVESRKAAIPLSDGHLRDAVASLQAGTAQSDDITVTDGRVLVEVLHDGDAAAASNAITTRGGQISGTAGKGLLQALVPVDGLVALERSPHIRSIRVPHHVDEPLGVAPTTPDPDPSLTVLAGQEIAKTKANLWQANGYTGAGVKVGIVDGFQGATWNAAQAAGEVPAPADVFCLNGGVACDLWASTSKHGIGVAEVIHEMAPDAQLYLARAVTTADLQAAVDWFASKGVTILSRSLTATYDGPGDGTGPIDDVVDSAVAQGITWFNASGNSGGGGTRTGSYWRGTFSDTDGDGWLDFDGTDEALAVPCGSGRFINGLRWSDWGANPTDYDVYLWEDSGLSVLKASGTANQGLGADPIETLSSSCSDDDYISVTVAAQGNGTAGDVLEILVNSTGIEHWSNPYAAAIPGADSASPGLVAVGAVDPATGTSLATYSSQGPANDARIKPDMSAAACVSSFSFPAPSCFAGSSAATPVVAGAAALVQGAGLASTPAAMKTYLLTHAVVDRGVAGADNAFGAGELVLPTLDATAPTISLAKPVLAKAPMSGSSLPVQLTWSAGDVGGGLAGFTVQRRTCSTTTGTCSSTWTTVASGLPAAATTATVMTGTGYFEFRVTATDTWANATSSAARIKLTGYQNTSSKWTLTSGKWTRKVSSGSAWGSSYARSKGSGGRATITVSKGTRQVALVSRVYGSAGVATVYVDGVKRATVNLATVASAGYKRLVWTFTVSTGSSHKIQVRRQSGTVNIDALVAVQ